MTRRIESTDGFASISKDVSKLPKKIEHETFNPPNYIRFRVIKELPGVKIGDEVYWDRGFNIGSWVVGGFFFNSDTLKAGLGAFWEEIPHEHKGFCSECHQPI